jgi:hypothetical protein
MRQGRDLLNNIKLQLPIWCELVEDETPFCGVFATLSGIKK